jgi:hypothetical protein
VVGCEECGLMDTSRVVSRSVLAPRAGGVWFRGYESWVGRSASLPDQEECGFVDTSRLADLSSLPGREWVGRIKGSLLGYSWELTE